MTITLGLPTCTGTFTLVCVECRHEIEGTVSLETAAQAGRQMAKKGGVKCPQCRANSCPTCGSGKVTHGHTPDRPNRINCTLCHLETGHLLSDVLV